MALRESCKLAHICSFNSQESEKSTASKELAGRMEYLQIKDRNFVQSPETTSTTSSSGGNVMSRFELQRSKLNAFLQECQIQALGSPWLEWARASQRTRQRYVQRTSEIISSVLKVVYPDDPGYLWNEPQTSTTVSKILGDKTVCPPSDRSYLEALAEAYSDVKAWDTRKQVSSIMAGIASYKALLAFIPGLTPYRYTQAKLHRLQHGRTVPVPKKEAPRLRIDRRQLDHFLSFITSPHLVQDLPFGVKNLKLSNGQSIAVPNVIRTLIPQRIVRQYKQYCSDTNFSPFSERTMTRILSECSASVRKSLQGLDYFAAEGARALDDLSTVLEQALENGARKERVQGLQEALKAGKLYLKGDSKVIHFFLYLKTLEGTSIYLFLHPLFGFFWERVMSK